MNKSDPRYCAICDWLYWDLRDRVEHEREAHPKADPVPGIDDGWLRLPSGFE